MTLCQGTDLSLPLPGDTQESIIAQHKVDEEEEKREEELGRLGPKAKDILSSLMANPASQAYFNRPVDPVRDGVFSAASRVIVFIFLAYLLPHKRVHESSNRHPPSYSNRHPF